MKSIMCTVWIQCRVTLRYSQSCSTECTFASSAQRRNWQDSSSNFSQFRHFCLMWFPPVQYRDGWLDSRVSKPEILIVLLFCLPLLVNFPFIRKLPINSVLMPSSAWPSPAGWKLGPALAHLVISIFQPCPWAGLKKVCSTGHVAFKSWCKDLHGFWDNFWGPGLMCVQKLGK